MRGQVFTLLFPYVLLGGAAGARHCILAVLPLQPGGESRVGEHLAEYRRIKWSKRFLGDLKRLTGVAVLTLLANFWLGEQGPWFQPVLVAGLALGLLARSLTLLILLPCCAGTPVTPFYTRLTALTLPWAGPSLRAAAWGAGFLAAGAAALAGWASSGAKSGLPGGFILLTLGFISLGGSIAIGKEKKVKAGQL